jgi:hypothetical protein
MFRQVVYRALVALLTFSVGVALSSSPRPESVESRTEPQPLSVCEALENPRLMNQGDVRLRGMLYGNPDGTLVLNEMDCSGEGAWLGVSFDDSLALKAETLRFVDRMRKQSTGETMARAEVLIIGKLVTESREGGGSTRYIVSVHELEPLSEISIISFVSN